jgi:hypothetical protein
MPIHQTPFLTAPDLHSDDWAGQIGKQRDPITFAPLAGWIYDCNQHGHVIRPYVPPTYGPAHAHIIVDDPDIMGPFNPWATTFPLDQSEPYQSWYGGSIESPLVAELEIVGPFEDGLWHCACLIGRTDFGEAKPHAIVANPSAPFILTAEPPDLPGTVSVFANLNAGDGPSDAQLTHRERIAALAQDWRDLDPETKAQWNATARRKAISGYAAFIANAFLPNPLHH